MHNICLPNIKYGYAICLSHDEIFIEHFGRERNRKKINSVILTFIACVCLFQASSSSSSSLPPFFLFGITHRIRNNERMR